MTECFNCLGEKTIFNGENDTWEVCKVCKGTGDTDLEFDDLEEEEFDDEIFDNSEPFDEIKHSKYYEDDTDS